MAIHHNQDAKAVFIIDNLDKQFIYETDCFYDDLSEIDEELVSIKECSRISVLFKSSIRDSYLLIKNIFHGGEDYIRVHPGECKKLFEDKNDYSMLVPGNYEMKVKIYGNMYYSMFTISPRHINDMQLQYLRKYIDEQVRGLVYNMNSSSIINAASMERSLPYYINLYNCYEKKFLNIKNYIDDIAKNPISSLSKKYERGHNTKKVDAKLIRLNERRREQSELQIKVRQDSNTRENAFLKKVIIDMYHELRDIEKNLMQCIKKMNYEIDFRKKEYNLKERVMINSRQSDCRNQDVERKNKSLNYSLEGLNEIKLKTQYIVDYLNNTKKMISILMSFTRLEFLKGINEHGIYGHNKTKFKDLRYHRLYRIYKYINEDKYNAVLNYKSSDLLYEYYILLITIRALGEFGYDLKDCDFKNLLGINFVDKIPEGLGALLYKDDIRVEVWYEEEVFSTSSEAMNFGGGFYTHTSNKLPDIRVDIYKNNILQRSFIIEVKYRRFSNIWNDNVNNDTMMQIKNYKMTIQYISKDIERVVSPIKKVIVVYPGQQDIDVVTEREWGDYAFVQIRPDENGEGIFGFEEYKSMLQSMVDVE